MLVASYLLLETPHLDFADLHSLSVYLENLVVLSITLDGLRTRVPIYSGSFNILRLDLIHRYTGTFDCARPVAVTMIAKPGEANHA